MKISCIIEVNNRLLPSLSLSSRRAQKSTLRIVSDSSTDNNIVLLHQTNDNIKGSVYKVFNNIEKVFSRFIDEGKVTIRLKAPPVDLGIKGDCLELKCFLKTLHALLRKDSTVKTLTPLTTVNSSPSSCLRLPPQKKKLIINSRSEYPAGGYPRTLEFLQVNNFRMKDLDSRIFRLTSLQVLNVSKNFIYTIPKELGQMRLKELHLADNKLGQTNNWNWICYTPIQNSLQLLDLSSNQLKCIPVEISRFRKLVTLKLTNNELVKLPPGIGRLKTLRNLSVAKNKIEWFPSSFQMLKLTDFDISENNYKPAFVPRSYSENLFCGISLKQLAAEKVLHRQLAYSPETLPQTVISYLDCFTICQCWRPTLAVLPHAFVEFNEQRISSSVFRNSTQGESKYSVLGLTFCSVKCALGFLLRPI